MYSQNKIVSGVYGIKNINNNKWYVGSSINIKSRIDGHKRLLLKGAHHNSHLQNAFNLYGIDSFIYLQLEECDVLNRVIREDYWIKKLKSINNGYNIRDASMVTISEETKEKISKSMKGINTWTKGVKRSKLVCEKLKISLTGLKRSKESKERYRQSKIGDNNPAQKIPISLAIEIKKEYESGGITVRGLAGKYFVSKGCIQRIIKGNRYGIL